MAIATVMPGLVPGIHVFSGATRLKDVDGRHKPGHERVRKGFREKCE
jgi:hypothetical protein